jgi:hypothetical protein
VAIDGKRESPAIEFRRQFGASYDNPKSILRTSALDVLCAINSQSITNRILS